MQYPKSLERLFSIFHRLPGVGRRTAQRYAFDLLMHWDAKEIEELTAALQELKNIGICETCGCLSETGHCLFCTDAERRSDVLCIVASPKEVFTLENTREFYGTYHVLSGLLSPLDGRGVEKLGLDRLFARLEKGTIKEVILALDSSLEGDTTSLFLKEQLHQFPVTVSRLAFGIPVGSALEYVDGGSLARALAARGPV
ncbi:MAG: recombination protein RecR [Verrucomicrobia bacterium]|nr:recombination protein RecR [Verrucomicrobiota bacterium]